MAGFMKSAMNLLGIKKEGEENTTFEGVSLEDFLGEIVARAGYDVQFEKVQDAGEDTPLKYEITGPDAEDFLGANSEMLESLAHLSFRFLRKTGAHTEDAETGRYLRVEFDCGDFRDRKNQELHDLAAGKRQKVLDNNGKPAYINALGPAERKVIHTFITETGDVVSESIGSGYFKRIRIRLKDDNRRSRDDRGGNRNNRRGGKGRGGKSRRGGAPRRDNANQEVNGNVIAPEETFDDVDENIGNKLAPGEESPFSFDSYDNENNTNN